MEITSEKKTNSSTIMTRTITNNTIIHNDNNNIIQS